MKKWMLFFLLINLLSDIRSNENLINKKNPEGFYVLEIGIETCQADKKRRINSINIRSWEEFTYCKYVGMNPKICKEILGFTVEFTAEGMKSPKIITIQGANLSMEIKTLLESYSDKSINMVIKNLRVKNSSGKSVTVDGKFTFHT